MLFVHVRPAPGHQVDDIMWGWWCCSTSVYVLRTKAQYSADRASCSSIVYFRRVVGVGGIGIYDRIAGVDMLWEVGGGEGGI